ncbi:MAG TPA: hypothetical protein VI454_02380 [Verrucomicrobiae bacterium]|jgi:hypothetical protein
MSPQQSILNPGILSLLARARQPLGCIRTGNAPKHANMVLVSASLAG